MNRKRWYIGLLNGTGKRQAFQAGSVPTAETHGNEYGAVIGPFRTRRGCFWALNQHNNPHCQCVQDAERLAKMEAVQ
jgi:hypothetical protein